MKEVKIEFYECEHGGDLDNYKSDMINCGAKIVREYLDADNEEGILTAYVGDDFMTKWKETESYDFSSVIYFKDIKQ